MSPCRCSISGYLVNQPWKGTSMKTCSNCKEIKSIFDFHKKTQTKLQSWCKACQLLAKRVRRQSGNTSERERESSRKRAEEYRKQNPEKAKSSVSEWKLKNPARLNYLNSKRKKDVRQATPRWLTNDDKRKIAEHRRRALPPID